ncbi:MAG: hypothetical protein ABIJ18_00455 [archaeon]
MQALKTLKKIAAIGTGIAMAGATMTGALALDLADYPSPYVVDGTYDDSTALVVGDNAVAADTLGMADIVANLQFESKTAVTSTDGTTVSVEGGKTEQVPIAMSLTTTTFFDSALQDDDIANLFDGEVSFQGKSYDTSEELQLLSGGPVVVNSFNSSDDDYADTIAVEVQKRDIIKFYYKFDESINLSTASTSQPLEIDFMGDNIRVTSFNAAANKFTAYVGEEHYLLVDESVTVDVDGVEKTVTLEEAGSSSVVVNVDGTTEIIASSNTQIVNGVEITVDSTFSRTERTESSAVLIIGKDSSETYQDGEAYIGEDTTNPNWVWDLGGLTTQGTAQTFGVENDFITNAFDDGPLLAGDCISLPNDYVQICFDSLSVGDSDFALYTFSRETDFDPSGMPTAYEDLDTVYIDSAITEGLELNIASFGNATGGYNETATKRTNKVWLFYNGSTCSLNGTCMGAATAAMDVFYYDSSSSKTKYFGPITTDGALEILRFNYGNTKDTDIVLKTNGTSTSTEMILHLDIAGKTTNDFVAAADDIYMEWSAAATGISALGATVSSEEAGELMWGATSTGIGTKDENHRSNYGIVIQNPKSNGPSDQVKLSVPNEQQFANIVIKGTSSTVTGGATSWVPAEITPATKLASEVSTPSDYQLILVGGPCANDLVEDLFDLTCDGWSFETGEAVVKLAENGNKVAMVVAGTDAADTRRAAKAVASYADYDFSGTEALVTGTSDEDIEVGAVPEEVFTETEEEAIADIVDEETA